MIPYTAPLADMRFLLTRVIGLDNLTCLEGYEGATEDLLTSILDEAAKLAVGSFAPLNDSGDKEGVTWTDGRVTMPLGFRDAYQAFVEGGWNGLAVDSTHGGQGLPWSFAMPVQEMLQAANLSLALCTLLNQGATELVAAHGDERLHRLFLPKMVSGEWAGTMNLTEPQAGSDVGAVRTKAVKENDHYRITGQKIFISYGEHDLTSNIIHLVLARLPDAPEGTKGLSLFLVPQFLVEEDGTLGDRNDVRVVATEHKLGQHASPTCTLAYGDHGGAIGYRVGAENGGIAAMFTMMNNARIGVGLQGLGLMERAYQQALDYAKGRVQSRDVANPKAPPVTILHHPDVRRMLLSMKAQIEAARALAYHCAYAIDLSKHGDAAQRAFGLARVDILTPLVKAWLTDLANEVTSTAVQVFGGMGDIEETGVAQHMRDARVLAIYEGTNGIQANDLVFRKLARDDGAAFYVLLDEAQQIADTLARATDPQILALHGYVALALSSLRESGAWILTKAKENPAQAAASAVPFLRLMANTLGGVYLGKSAWIATEDRRANRGDAVFLNAKTTTARFYAEHILPHCAALAVTVITGSTSTLALQDEEF